MWRKGSLFWALFLLCCRWLFFFRKRRFLEKQDPWKGEFLMYFWSCLSKCPNVDFSRKLLLEGSCSVTWRSVFRVWRLRRIAGASLRPRFFTEKTRAKNQNVRFAWCSDFKTRAKWTKKSETSLARFASFSRSIVFYGVSLWLFISCFTVFLKNSFCAFHVLWTPLV